MLRETIALMDGVRSVSTQHNGRSDASFRKGIEAGAVGASTHVMTILLEATSRSKVLFILLEYCQPELIVLLDHEHAGKSNPSTRPILDIQCRGSCGT